MAKDETPPTEENAQTTKEDALGVFQAFSGWSCQNSPVPKSFVNTHPDRHEEQMT